MNKYYFNCLRCDSPIPHVTTNLSLKKDMRITYQKETFDTKHDSYFTRISNGRAISDPIIQNLFDVFNYYTGIAEREVEREIKREDWKRLISDRETKLHQINYQKDKKCLEDIMANITQPLEKQILLNHQPHYAIDSTCVDEMTIRNRIQDPVYNKTKLIKGKIKVDSSNFKTLPQKINDSIERSLKPYRKEEIKIGKGILELDILHFSTLDIELISRI